jgi:hypothetical protein
MKHILTIAAILLTTTAHAYTPVRPCHYCDRPIPPTTSGHYYNDRSEHQAMKALATTAIALSVIAILIELQPSRIDGQVKLAQF